MSLTSADGNNSIYNYTYDTAYSRLTSISETTPYAQFTKNYQYDTFGRVETEEYVAQLLSNNNTSVKKIKNVYQNGDLKTISDFSTNQNIWNLTGVNARGQVTESHYGNNSNKEVNTFNSFGYVTNKKVLKTASSQILMELTTDFNTERGTLNSRSNTMFSWSETFEYDDLDRLITFNDNDGDNSQSYDDLGRITSNNTVGDYNYSSTSYQLGNLDLNNQGDLYYQQNQLQQIKFNAFKKPFEINEAGKEKIGFQYNAFNGRSNMFYGDTEEDIYDRKNRKHN
jgi:YD repeat-containing protein